MEYIFGTQDNLGMDGLFERDLPASVALAGSYGTRSSSAYLLSSTQALTSTGGRPPGKCQSANKTNRDDKDKDSPTTLVSATAIVGAAVPNCQKCQSVSAITWITCLWGLDCSPGDWGQQCSGWLVMSGHHSTRITNFRECSVTALSGWAVLHSCNVSTMFRLA